MYLGSSKESTAASIERAGGSSGALVGDSKGASKSSSTGQSKLVQSASTSKNGDSNLNETQLPDPDVEMKEDAEQKKPTEKKSTEKKK